MEHTFHSNLEPDEASLVRDTLAVVLFLLVPLPLAAIASLLKIDGTSN
jgi:hypothetical protein